jgi:acetyl-CoA carboxylase biotin carboxyl carrier protein
MSEFDDITRMIDLMDAHDLEELEVERDGVRLRVKKRGAAVVPPVMAPAVPFASPDAVPADAASETPLAGAGLFVVKSPIVGTFFRASEPGATPFVEIGSQVTRGQALCIIEAMKLMNEIDAEDDGEVVQAFVEDGQPVQYGDPLFAIRPA